MRAVLTAWLLVAGLLSLGSACRSSGGDNPPAGSGSPPPRLPVGDCGTRPDDWCPAPPGDPCGIHGDADSCRADPRCGGMPYRGESAVACRFDARDFGLNCPTVGCITRRK